MVRFVKSGEIDKLAAELNEIAGDWELFAGQLGVSRGKRKQIATNNAGKPNYAARCLVDALYCWVESSDNPTYEDVVDALTKPGNFVTSRPLAEEIIENYGLKNTAKIQGADLNKYATSYRLKISFIITVVFLLVCILVSFLVATFVEKFMVVNDVASNSQPEQQTQTASVNTSEQMCTEVQNIRLLGRYPVNATAQHNLPYLPGIFVGRDEALVELTHLLLHHRISGVNAVAIYGPPAVGKSTLAIHVGYELLNQGVDVRYIDIQESDIFRAKDTNFVSDPNVDSQLQPTAESKYESQLAKRSSDIAFPDDKNHVHEDVNVRASDLLRWAKNLQNETLLILDNCDFLIHKTAIRKNTKAFLRKLGNASPRLRILITSQQKVQLIGFRPYPLKFLDTESAMQLLRHESSVHLSDSDCKTICEQVDKSPLALKIAAHILSEDTSLKKFIESLKNSPINVLNKDVGLPENSTLLAVLSSAYKYLNNNTKLCGQYISNFPGSFDSVVGGRVLQMCLGPTQSSDECLRELVERSMIESYHLADQIRYRFHRLIRAFFKHVYSETDFTVHDTDAMMETFNRSLVHCYSDSFAKVVQACRYDCSEEKIASLEYEDHNFWQVMKTMKYLCTSTKSISISVIMNWTTVLTSGIRNVISVIMTYEERAEMIGSVLKCMDRHVNNISETIGADQTLDMYATLLNFARVYIMFYLREQKCYLPCENIHQSDSRSELFDTLYSASTKTAYTRYGQLKYTTNPSFCMNECFELQYEASPISMILSLIMWILHTILLKGATFIIFMFILYTLATFFLRLIYMYMYMYRDFLTAIAFSIVLSKIRSLQCHVNVNKFYIECQKAYYILCLIFMVMLMMLSRRGFTFWYYIDMIHYMFLDRYGILFVILKILAYTIMIRITNMRFLYFVYFIMIIYCIYTLVL